jgi:cytoskeleton-associated protein 5
LDKGLDAALSFVQHAQCATKTFGEVGPHISSKCLGGSKAKLKEKGQQLLLMYEEIEQQNAVIEELVSNLEAKNPKVVQASVETLRMGLK